MKNNFVGFPKIVFFDGTCKLLNFNDGIVNLFLVEDSVRSSEIATIDIFGSEFKEYIIIGWFFHLK